MIETPFAITLSMIRIRKFHSIVILALLVIVPALPCAQPGDESVGTLIEKLGSPDFHQRQSATSALKNRPDAAPALRAVLKSADPETRQRAAQILDYITSKPLRELDAAVKAGRLDRVTEKLADWPAGKQEDVLWETYCAVARDLAARHENRGGEKIKLRLDGGPRQLVVVAKRITEDTKGQFDSAFFLRAGEVDLVYSRRDSEMPAQNCFHHDSCIVARGPVKMIYGHPRAILAGGNVEVHGSLKNTLIVSGGDVTIVGSIGGSLVIARGKIV
ncbi:MAG: hypothetical protein HY289_10470, partial [Planctomycetes bacterium]|nr:hypothetical protein [Planctomycetota bacterium]